MYIHKNKANFRIPFVIIIIIIIVFKSHAVTPIGTTNNNAMSVVTGEYFELS